MEPLAQLLGRGTKKKGGGLLTLINTKYAANSEELLDLSRSTADIEVQWIIIHREHCKDVVVGQWLILGGVGRALAPPSQKKKRKKKKKKKKKKERERGKRKNICLGLWT